VARNFFGYSDAVDVIAEESIRDMRRAGAIVVDPANIDTASQMSDSEFEVLLYEFKADIAKYLAGRFGPHAPAAASRARGALVLPPRTLADLIAFNEAHEDREMPYFRQEIFAMAEKKGPLSSPEYGKALEKNRRLSRREGIDAVMDAHRLDAIVAPTSAPAFTTDLVNGDHYTGGCSSPAAVAGYPHVTVPAGFAYGLPAGISFFGRAWSEPTLIRIAFAFEQATRARRAPRFLATADLGA
jgi:amidase